MSRVLIALLVALCLTASLAACGKKGDPKVPGQDQFPRTYPAPQ